ncbi:MAG: hypothetical protein ACFCVE_09590 [Phycisphaerae bacterium]
MHLTSRKFIFPLAAVVVGLAVIALEVAALVRGDADGGAWFWLPVAALALAMGVVGLVDGLRRNESALRKTK